MIAGLGPYPAYRDFGADLFPEVPVAWATPALRELGRFSKGVGGTKDDEVDSGVPCVRYGDLYTQHEMFITATRSYIDPARAADYTRSEPGDVLFAASGETIEEIGKSAVNLVPGEVRVGGDVILFRPVKPVNARFLGYALEARSAVLQKARMGKGVTVMHIYPQTLRNLRLSLPPLEDQAAIVRYLDYVDSRIQRLIAAKERLVELLEEEKQAIIHRAVTRGLDPDVPLKPSGVDWSGDVPGHWAARRIKTLARMKAGDSITVDSIEQSGAFPVYGGNGLRGYTDRPSHCGARLLIGRQGALCGNVHVVDGEYWASEHAIVVEPTSGCDLGWLHALLTAINLNQHSQAAAQPGLSTDRIRNLTVPVPPVAEQQLIRDEIDEESNAIAAAASNARRNVELLREYRTRLISDVVTGKLDVREAAGRLPADPELAAPELDEQLEEAVA